MAIHDEEQKQEQQSKYSLEPLRKHRRIKYFAIFIVGLLLKFLILGILFLTIFRFKDPEINLESPILNNFFISNGSSAAINMTLSAEIAIKNQNWGKFKYDETDLVLFYRGVKVGEGDIPKGRVKMRSIKRLDVAIEVNFDGLRSDQNLSNDIDSGTLILNSYAKFSGKVHMIMMEMIKKRRTGEMNCSMNISLSRKKIQDYSCH